MSKVNFTSIEKMEKGCALDLINIMLENGYTISVENGKLIISDKED